MTDDGAAAEHDRRPCRERGAQAGREPCHSRGIAVEPTGDRAGQHRRGAVPRDRDQIGQGRGFWAGG